MVVPALLAGGSMGSGGASLILICEGIEEGVAKRMGGLGEAALTSGDAEGSMVLKMTRMGSLSGAWMMKMRRWALLMPPGPSYLSRYPLRDQVGLTEAVPPAALPLSTLPFLTQKGPKEPIPEEQELDFQGLEEEEEEPSEGVDEEGPEAGEPLKPCREPELFSNLRCLCACAYIHVQSQDSEVWSGTSTRCEQNDLWSPLEALGPAGTHTALTTCGS